MRYVTWIYTILAMLQIGRCLMYKMSNTTGPKSCKTGVCFNWKLSNMKLILICKIEHYHFKAFIEDPRGHVQANCLPPSDIINCHAKYKNVTVTLSNVTNELIFTLRGVINTQVNGNWTCRHGTKRDIAHVEVTVLTYVDNQRDNESVQTLFGDQCIDVIICISALSYICAIVTTLVIMSFFPKMTTLDDLLTRQETPINCIRNIYKSKNLPKLKKITFAVSTVIFFGFAIFIGRIESIDCSTKWLFIGFGFIFGVMSSLTCLNKYNRSSREEESTNISSQETGDPLLSREESTNISSQETGDPLLSREESTNISSQETGDPLLSREESTNISSQETGDPLLSRAQVSGGGLGASETETHV